MQHSSYLESKVLTAPSQRLHLMLVEAAIRFGRQAEDALRRGERTAAAAPLLRAIDIVSELLASVRANKSELNRQIADQYWFMLRRVSEAKINADVGALAEALRLLEYERETWQMLCDKLSSGGQAGPPVPHTSAFVGGRASGAKTGFSLEA
jgi:flagellar protein FliS